MMARVPLPKHQWLNIFRSGKRSVFDMLPLCCLWSAPLDRKARTPVLQFWYISVAFSSNPRSSAEQQSPKRPHSHSPPWLFFLFSLCLAANFLHPAILTSSEQTLEKASGSITILPQGTLIVTALAHAKHRHQVATREFAILGVWEDVHWVMRR